MNKRLTPLARWALPVMLVFGAAAAQALTVRASASCAAGADRDSVGLHDTEVTFTIRCTDETFPGITAISGSAVLVDSRLGTAELQATSFARVEVRGGFTSARAGAGAFFEVSTVVEDTPPFMPDFLPVDLHITGRGSTRTGSRAGAALVDSFGHLLFNYEWIGDDPGSGFENAERIYIAPGGGIGLGKGVSCVSEASLFGTPDDVPSTDCFVSFDPVATFSQAEFDRTWGAASFELDRYFSLNLAPPVSVGVPEPSAALLLLVGVGALARTSRRRCAVRSSPLACGRSRAL